MKINILKLIISLILINSIFANEQADKMPHPFESDCVKVFAQDLYQNGFWDEAESEFKRYLFLSQKNNDFVDNEIIFRLASIYNSTQNLDGSIWLYNNFSDSSTSEVSEKLYINCTSMIFKMRNADLFSPFEKQLSDEYSPEINLLIPISSALLNKDIELSKKLVNEASQNYSIFLETNNIFERYSTKNPYLAMTLSILIPGSGKWYTGSFKSFISSFLTVGGFTAGTIYTGIKYDWKDWRPYIFGSCALFFYISDIYGSYKSAQRYNEAQYRLLTESVDVIYENLF